VHLTAIPHVIHNISQPSYSNHTIPAYPAAQFCLLISHNLQIPVLLGTQSQEGHDV